MIGVIGPRDSMELVLAVAREMRLLDALVPRIYADPREAPGLAAELQSLCKVTLYTGRVPLVLAGTPHGGRADYIPHGGADLYRTIGALLLLPSFRGGFPSLSIDSIDAAHVAEAFGELGLRAPRHVVPLLRKGTVDLSHITAEHARLFRAGEVQFCLTCIGHTFKELTRLGIPAMRIVHSRLVIRESLAKARLALDLTRAEAGQVAACVISLQKTGGSRTDRESLARKFLAAGRKCATSLDGWMIKQAPREVVVLTTRGAAEHALKSGLLAARRFPRQLRGALAFGVGFGASASIAEQHARSTVEIADLPGTEVPVRSAEDSKQRRAGDLRAVRQLQVSPTIARRLIDVFAALDPESFTAAELAAAYRVSPRSARRLIALLRVQDLVEECGVEKRAGAGRPMPVYRIALSRLTSAIA